MPYLLKFSNWMLMMLLSIYSQLHYSQSPTLFIPRRNAIRIILINCHLCFDISGSPASLMIFILLLRIQFSCLDAMVPFPSAVFRKCCAGKTVVNILVQKLQSVDTLIYTYQLVYKVDSYRILLVFDAQLCRRHNSVPKWLERCVALTVLSNFSNFRQIILVGLYPLDICVSNMGDCCKTCQAKICHKRVVIRLSSKSPAEYDSNYFSWMFGPEWLVGFSLVSGVAIKFFCCD